MFIETLEFTIPLDLCDLFNSLKRGPKSNLEFPASVNSYGTTQDANIQVALRSNKLTFKVDGVSSNASMISKSECKTLKLSVFDVDCTLMGEQESYDDASVHSLPYLKPAKRSRDRPMAMRTPPTKSSRNSFSESSVKSRDIPQESSDQTECRIDTENVNIKQEPDLIEIEPDPEQYEEDSIHNNRDSDRLTSQAALERLSHTHSSTSSSSSFRQNVPHVPDYAEPGPSQGGQGDQSADDYLVYQETGDNDYDDDNDNSGDFGNDGFEDFGGTFYHEYVSDQADSRHGIRSPTTRKRHVCSVCGLSYSSVSNLNQHMRLKHEAKTKFQCEVCQKMFIHKQHYTAHMNSHSNIKEFKCDVCFKEFSYESSLRAHYKKNHPSDHSFDDFVE